MDALSLIALILLSLVGYSAGVVLAVRGVSDPKPGIFDLFLIVLIWGGAVYAKVNTGINRWLLILVCAVSACLIAWLISLLRKGRQGDIKSESHEGDRLEGKPSLWKRWTEFSKRMGGFESRVVLSLFYFIIVLPFALIVRLFSDPLRLKMKSAPSHWLATKPLESAEDNFRKQF
jgi:hypothetical protein